MVIKAVFSHPLSHSPLSPASSTPLHPIPAADLLTVEFSLDVWCGPQFSGVSEAIHFTAEVLVELIRAVIGGLCYL